MIRGLSAAASLIAIVGLVAAPASARRYYGGGKHTSSHGGRYSGSYSGSSHKGGTYRNVSTSNRYGRHR